MDRPAIGGWNRRGDRGFGRPGSSGAAAGWTSSTGTTRSTADLDLDFAGGERGTRGGRGIGGRRGAGGQMQGGGHSRLVWRPKCPCPQASPTPASSAEADAVSCSATLDNDDLLGQILLRLPPLPSSLPRAAAVCERWRRLVADPGFLRRFRAHHGKAPLIGFFFYNRGKIGFTSVLDPPDPIPAADRLTLRLPKGSKVHGCRHGLVLGAYGNSFLVWDPVSGEQYHLPFPSVSGGTKYALDATIICAASATDQGHVHGACHSSPFWVIFLGRRGDQIITYIFSSETGTWGDAISMTCLNPFDPDDFLSCNTLVGNTIYWLLNETTISILEFDLDRQSLATIELPPNLIDIITFVREDCEFLIMPAEDCGLGLLIIAGFIARIWKRKSSCDGNAGWVLINTIKLDNHLRLKPWAYTFPIPPVILGFAEDHNVLFLLTGGGVIFMVHLDSWQFKKLPHRKRYRLCYPFTSFCAAGLGPLYPVTSVPQVMNAKDSWCPFEAINGREPNSVVEVGVADWWDPMVLEASVSATSVQNQMS